RRLIMKSPDWPRSLGAIIRAREPTKSPVQIRPAPPYPRRTKFKSSGLRLITDPCEPIATIRREDYNRLELPPPCYHYEFGRVQAGVALFRATIRRKFRRDFCLAKVLRFATRAGFAVLEETGIEYDCERGRLLNRLAILAIRRATRQGHLPQLRGEDSAWLVRSPVATVPLL